MARFERVAHGIGLHLARAEADVLGSLAAGLAERAAADTDPSADDPVMRRFAPEVSRGDADVDAEVRGMLRPDLLTLRAERLRDLAGLVRPETDDAEDVVLMLDRAEAMRVVEALNDLRLALAVTVGLDAVERDEVGEDDERSDALRLIDALAWVQGGLIDFVERD